MFSAMKPADFNALRAAQDLLKQGLKPEKLRAARRKVQLVSARAGVRELEIALDALIAMAKAPSIEAVALAVKAERAARSYWNEPGPVRGAALRALVVAVVLGAEHLALLGESKQALAKLAEAKALQAGLLDAIHDMAAVETRIRAAIVKKSGPRKRVAKTGKPQPRAKLALAKARSFRRGTLGPGELTAMAKLVKRSDLREMAREMDAFDGDAMLVEGDLNVPGDFRAKDVGVIWLVVKGDLVVDGLYEDTCDDAPDHVFVAGSLRAADVVTAGALDVGGDLVASGVVVGDYNDGDARVRGDLRARLFAPYDHAFRIDGKIRAEAVLLRDGEKARRGTNGKRWSDLDLAAVFTEDELVTRLRRRLPILG